MVSNPPVPLSSGPGSSPSPVSHHPSGTRHWLRLLKRLAACLVVLGLLLLTLYAFRTPLLTGMGQWWVVDEPLSKADAIMVLGGGLPRRPIEAARLYRAGLAPKVLYSDVTTNQLAQLGMDKPETTLTREVLIQQGVPEAALQRVGHGVTSTYLESLAVRDWLRQTGAKSVIIPTDEFHTRRVRWVFRKVLRPIGAQLQVKPVVHPDFTTTNWWWKEEGVVAFQNEVLKYLYYRLKY